MAKETDGRDRATMNEADLEYLRNINTRPGPNAGRSIDPTKPGPDAAIAQSDAEPVACAIANRSNELGLDLDGEVALHGICQEELERARQPRPDASAGLIEAAEIASAFKGNADRRMRSDAGREGYVRACNDLVVELRARAADRSGK